MEVITTDENRAWILSKAIELHEFDEIHLIEYEEAILETLKELQRIELSEWPFYGVAAVSGIAAAITISAGIVMLYPQLLATSMELQPDIIVRKAGNVFATSSVTTGAGIATGLGHEYVTSTSTAIRQRQRELTAANVERLRGEKSRIGDMGCLAVGADSRHVRLLAGTPTDNAQLIQATEGSSKLHWIQRRDTFKVLDTLVEEGCCLVHNTTYGVTKALRPVRVKTGIHTDGRLEKVTLRWVCVLAIVGLNRLYLEENFQENNVIKSYGVDINDRLLSSDMYNDSLHWDRTHAYGDKELQLGTKYIKLQHVANNSGLVSSSNREDGCWVNAFLRTRAKNDNKWKRTTFNASLIETIGYAYSQYHPSTTIRTYLTIKENAELTTHIEVQHNNVDTNPGRLESFPHSQYPVATVLIKRKWQLATAMTKVGSPYKGK
jgi:hypothetical protein